MKLKLTIILLFINLLVKSQSMNLNCSGIMNQTITTGEMNLEAGNSISSILPTITFPVNSAVMSFNMTGNRYYDLYISRQEINWNNNIQIWTRRTGVGNASNISGGTAYQQINLTPNFYYNWRGNINQNNPVPMQFELRFTGVVDPGNYFTRILITVTAL